MEKEGRKKAEYRSSLRSKQMIKEALLSLMIEKPFDKISITDIVKRADINRGTFYAHYPNTSEVLKSISESVVDEIAAVFSTYDASAVLVSPEQFLRPITAFLMRDPQYYAKLVQADRFYEVLNDTRYTAIDKILQDLKPSLTPEMYTTLTIVLDYAISGILTVYEDILLRKIPVSLDESVEYISKVLRPQKAALDEALQQIQK
jgi:AcrR family transcriptional regulator